MKTANIIGYGLSGKSAHQLLARMGYDNIRVYDDANSDNDCNILKIADFMDDHNLTTISPGIDRRRYPNLPNISEPNVVSEVELAYNLLPHDAKVAIITGSNGKSSVAHLVEQILSFCGISAVACGNIGVPFGKSVLDGNAEVYILELSSFQIEMLHFFNADIFALLNISPNHQERYDSYEDYTEAKLKILNFACKDSKTIVGDNPALLNAAKKVKGNLSIISSEYVVEDEKLRCGNWWLDLAEYHLYGTHNILNLIFAVEIASSFVDIEGDVTKLVKNLTNLEHRLERFTTDDKVTYINDSKATNIQALLTALSCMNAKVTLLAGGREKGEDYNLLRDKIEEKVSNLVLFGEASQNLFEAFKGKLSADISKHPTLKEALCHVASDVKPGDVVLLSPGCSSYDEFENFAARGGFFKSHMKRYETKQVT